jgi:formate dehydrogenase subunit gamma
MDANQLQVVQAELARGKTRPGPLLEVLLAIQEQLGFVPPAAVPVIADGLNLSRLAQHAKRRLGADFHATSPDGAVTLEAVFCLGNCARAPAMLVDGELHGCVTAQRFDAVIKELAGQS